MLTSSVLLDSGGCRFSEGGYSGQSQVYAAVRPGGAKAGCRRAEEEGGAGGNRGASLMTSHPPHSPSDPGTGSTEGASVRLALSMPPALESV